MTHPFAPTHGPVPPGPLAGPCRCCPSTPRWWPCTADGACGFAQKLGGVWKFKAMGYDAAGRMEPGHGPLTEQHNMAFAAPDAAEVSARLLGRWRVNLARGLDGLKALGTLSRRRGCGPAVSGLHRARLALKRIGKAPRSAQP